MFFIFMSYNHWISNEPSTSLLMQIGEAGVRKGEITEISSSVNSDKKLTRGDKKGLDRYFSSR